MTMHPGAVGKATVEFPKIARTRADHPLGQRPYPYLRRGFRRGTSRVAGNDSERTRSLNSRAIASQSVPVIRLLSVWV